jgi:hypothetical protein
MARTFGGLVPHSHDLEAEEVVEVMLGRPLERPECHGVFPRRVDIGDVDVVRRAVRVEAKDHGVSALQHLLVG